MRLGDLRDRLHPVEDVLPVLDEAVGSGVVTRHANDRHVARVGVRLSGQGRLRNELLQTSGSLAADVLVERLDRDDLIA